MAASRDMNFILREDRAEVFSFDLILSMMKYNCNIKTAEKGVYFL